MYIKPFSSYLFYLVSRLSRQTTRSVIPDADGHEEQATCDKNATDKQNVYLHQHLTCLLP